MRQDLQNTLRSIAPSLCSHEEFSRYGFEIPDGWFSLMLEAVEDLGQLNGPGGMLRLAQVKIKFDRLRICLADPMMAGATNQIIHRAEARALQECTVCGASTVAPLSSGFPAYTRLCIKHTP